MRLATAAAAMLAIAMATGQASALDSVPSLKRSDNDPFFHFNIDQKLANPYPELCPEQSGMNDDQIRDLNICILREKWIREIVLPTEVRFSPRRRVAGRYLPILYKSPRNDSAPVATAKDGSAEDCMFNSRNRIRPFPGKCRTQTFAKKYSSEAWYALWKEIQGDFSYMYDYVLWDETFPERKENQLWYLVLYMKILATTIHTPVDIYNVIKGKPKNIELAHRVAVLEKTIYDMCANVINALRMQGEVDTAKKLKSEVSLVMTQNAYNEDEKGKDILFDTFNPTRA